MRVTSTSNLTRKKDIIKQKAKENILSADEIVEAFTKGIPASDLHGHSIKINFNITQEFGGMLKQLQELTKPYFPTQSHLLRTITLVGAKFVLALLVEPKKFQDSEAYKQLQEEFEIISTNNYIQQINMKIKDRETRIENIKKSCPYKRRLKESVKMLKRELKRILYEEK